MKRKNPANRLMGERAQATRALYHDSDNQTVLVIFGTADGEYEFELTVREAKNLQKNLMHALKAIDSL